MHIREKKQVKGFGTGGSEFAGVALAKAAGSMLRRGDALLNSSVACRLKPRIRV
jgi:hypothetical protein